MAKASVKCLCKHCGATFISEKKCCNRRDADSWEKWAVAHFDMCPECFKKEQAEKLSKGEVVEMKYYEYKNNYSDRPTIPDSYNATTKTVLVVVKTAEEVAEERAMMQQRVNATKSEIFSAAHNFAKAMRAENPNMSYRECLSVCLKKVYAMVKEAKEYLAA